MAITATEMFHITIFDMLISVFLCTQISRAEPYKVLISFSLSTRNIYACLKNRYCTQKNHRAMFNIKVLPKLCFRLIKMTKKPVLNQTFVIQLTPTSPIQLLNKAERFGAKRVQSI